MEWLTIVFVVGTCAYLVIGSLIAALTVFTKTGDKSIEDLSYNYPITTDKLMWFILITLLWIKVVDFQAARGDTKKKWWKLRLHVEVRDEG